VTRSFLEGVRERLRAMALAPPYVYRDTDEQLIEAERRRLTQFLGYEEEEVAAAEGRLGFRFPAAFRTYLREMAKSPGDLFRGSDLARLSELEQFRESALEVMRESNPALTLPDDAIVFLSHQGYEFCYLLARDEGESPVFQYVEGDGDVARISESFAAFLEAELRLMEQVYAEWIEDGGYYRTLHRDGVISEEYPALASGERPLRKRRRPWWRFWSRG
jgi:hypothetical protein